MSRRLVAFACIVSTSAWANEVVSVSQSDCLRLIPHVPSADVAHRPGAEPVVPADLAPAGGAHILIDLKIPLASFGVTLPRQLGTASEVLVGVLAIDPLTGRATLNGEPLPDPARDAIADACARRLAR
jgi:hypothetical protein